MKNIMKEAHKLTREIKAEFPNVDYKFQLGICISYLSKNEMKEDDNMYEFVLKNGMNAKVKINEKAEVEHLEINNTVLADEVTSKIVINELRMTIYSKEIIKKLGINASNLVINLNCEELSNAIKEIRRKEREEFDKKFGKSKKYYSTMAKLSNKDDFNDFVTNANNKNEN